MTLAGWNPTKKIALIVDQADVSADLTDFPVLVNLGVSVGKNSFDVSAVFTEVGVNSKKIAVEIGDTAVQCYAEIEFWDSANNRAVLHVKVPSILAASGVVLNLYYDSAQPDNTTYIGDTGSTPAQNVWDTNFVAVYHMAQDPSGTAPQVLDSTSNANHGTSYGGMTSGDLIDGLTGKAIEFDGIDDYINIDIVLSSAGGLSTFSVEFASSTVEVGSDHFSIVFSVHDSDDLNRLRIANDTVWRVHDLDPGNFFVGTTTINDGIFHVSTVTGNNTNADLFVDGSISEGSGPHSITFASNGKMSLCQEYDAINTPGDFFGGVVSEVRISSSVRSDTWIAATNVSLRDNLIIFSLADLLARSVLYQQYDLVAVFVRNLLQQQYDITFDLITKLVQLYGLRNLVTLTQPYGNVSVVINQLRQYYGSAYVPTGTLTQLYEDYTKSLGTLIQPYTLPDAIKQSLNILYYISQGYVRNETLQPYAIKGVTPCKNYLKQIYSLPYEGFTINDDIIVSVDATGNTLDILSLDITYTQSEYVGNCTFNIKDENTWNAIFDTDAITVSDTVNLIDYKFLVVGKNKSESISSVSFSVQCKSQAFLLDFPYASEVPDTFIVAGKSSEVVNDLANLSGLSIIWELPVDPVLNSTHVQVSGISPLSGIRKIVNAFGGLLQSLPDGSIHAVPKYIVDTNKYSLVLSDYVFEAGIDLFSLSHSFSKRDGYNIYFISDKSSADGYTLQSEQVKSGEYIIKAFKVPWSTEPVILDTSELTGVSINFENYSSPEISETIEIVNGTGKVANPHYSTVSYTYGTRTNLGQLNFSEDGTLTTDIEGNSIVDVVYKTKYWQWRVKDTDFEQIQLILSSQGV